MAEIKPIVTQAVYMLSIGQAASERSPPPLPSTTLSVIDHSFQTFDSPVIATKQGGPQDDQPH
jgi:hypothetical protein